MFETYQLNPFIHLQPPPDGTHHLIIDPAPIHAQHFECLIDSEVLWQQFDKCIVVCDFLWCRAEVEGQLVQVQVGEAEFLVVPEGLEEGKEATDTQSVVREVQTLERCLWTGLQEGGQVA